MNDNLYRNINGLLQNDSPYTSADPALRSRFGVYETMFFNHGSIRNATLHWRRMLDGLSLLGFQLPVHYTGGYFEQLAAELVRANGQQEPVRIRLQVLKAGDSPEPFFYMESFPLDPAALQYRPEGLPAGILPGYHKPLLPESNLKISHNGFEVPAREALQHYGWEEVLLRNERGNIAESSIANLFLVKDGTLITPPLSEGCLAGTMRAWLMSRLVDAGYRVTEQPVTETMLLDADEIFLTNSIKPLRRVGQIGDRQLDGRVTTKIWQEILQQ